MSHTQSDMPAYAANVRLARRFSAACVLSGAATLAACGGGSAPTPQTVPVPIPGSATTSAAQTAAAWPVRTREYVDLWLHGLAMIVDDTARVPLFRPGYREELSAARTRAGVTTRLDAERDRLRARLASSPKLALDAQFVPFVFESWDALRRAVDAFVQSGGDPQRARDQQTAQAIAFLAGVFPTANDREWLRIFAGALDDEQTRFYEGYWTGTQHDRAAVRDAVTVAWTGLAPKLDQFLSHTQQRGGELLLSFPLGGEGRTQSGGASRNVVTVGFPRTVAEANDAIYTAVHEFVGTVAGPVVADNVSPADQRAGLADRYVSAAQVRGGLVLLQRAAPALAAGYARYYLTLVRAPAGADPIAALANAFPLPATLVDALTKQIDVALGGI